MYVNVPSISILPRHSAVHLYLAQSSTPLPARSQNGSTCAQNLINIHPLGLDLNPDTTTPIPRPQQHHEVTGPQDLNMFLCTVSDRFFGAMTQQGL